jgi:S-adenosylmethionine-dependent methyltransferase
MSAEVERYYDESAQREWERLERHPMELALTMRALADYLPTPPAAILDVGGGPGRYAIELARQGYAVTLVDLSRGCLDLAREKADTAGVALVDYVHGNALDLSRFPAAAYDASLLMGPLYHLVAVEDRERAVREAARVLRPDGRLFASVILRYALIRWAAKHQPDEIVTFRAEVERQLATGIATGDRRVSFTDAYFALPGELPALLNEAGFEVLDTLACEGVVSMIEDRLTETSGDLWQTWVDLNYRLSRDPSIFGAAEHLLCVGRKRSDTTDDHVVVAR